MAALKSAGHQITMFF